MPSRRVSIFLVLAAACAGPDPGPTGPRLAPRAPSRVIVDGAHDGRLDFHFLPPVARPLKAYEGTFDPTWLPWLEVRVCPIAAINPTTLACASTAGVVLKAPALRVDADAESYNAVWSPPAPDDYRVRVYVVPTQVGAIPTLLGTVDVRAVANGGDLKTVPAGYVALMSRASLNIRFRLETRIVGYSTVPIPRADACGRADGRWCESLVGDVVADAMRTTTGAELAITNSGGLRDQLTCPATNGERLLCQPYTPPPYTITTGSVLGVLPFGNRVVTLTIDGAELKAVLENGVSSMPTPHGKFPQVSGLCFTYDISAPVGSRVVGAVRQAADGSCTGTAIDLTAAASYAIAENDFMATGGDGYPPFVGRFTTGERMERAAIAYVVARTPISPAIQGRIRCTSSGAAVCPIGSQ